MEFINRQNIVELSNPGVFSKQLLNPENSSSERVTITEVHLVNQDIHIKHQSRYGMQRKERENYYLQKKQRKSLWQVMLFVLLMTMYMDC